MAARAPVDGSWAESVPAIERWLAGASAGEELVYATGMPSPPRHAPAWAHAGTLADEGEVSTHQRRQAPGSPVWEYFMRRRAVTLATCQAGAAAVVGIEDDDDPVDRVMKALRRAANFGRPCPTNVELARACRLEDAAQASYRVRQLVGLGRIRVEQQGVGMRRVVTIVASGKATTRGAA